MVDLNSGVYLRASKIQAFALPHCLTLTISSQCYAHLVSNSLSCRGIAGPRRLNRRSGQHQMCYCSWLPVFGITRQGLRVPLPFISIHLPDLQELHPLPGSFLQPISSSPLLGSLLFQDQYSLCAGAQPLTGGLSHVSL